MSGSEDGLMPTHRDYPWERDARAERERERRSPSVPLTSKLRQEQALLDGRRPVWRLNAKGILLTLALVLIVGFSIRNLIEEGSVAPGIGPSPSPSISPRASPNTSLPRAYVAVPGPMRWRCVHVVNPPHGTPGCVRQEYRIIHYVGAP
jgi:hypothetical protein